MTHTLRVIVIRRVRGHELSIQRTLNANARLVEHVSVNHCGADILYPVRYRRNRVLM
jgi:hypothetical protein